MAVRRELMLILKEALHNVLRHAEASRVTVTIHREGTRLTLSVADDGVGFDPSTVREGHGLGSLRARAARLGATLDVSSTPGEGTRVALAVDLARNREARWRRWAVPWAERPPAP